MQRVITIATLIWMCSLVQMYDVQGATITAIASGNWSSNSIWSCSCQPGNADNIIIPVGMTVTASGPEILFLGPVITITIWGTLVLNNASLQVDSSDIILIKTGGKINATGITGGAIYSGVIPDFVPNGSSIVGPKTITNGTLPVTLLFFEAAMDGSTVALTWATASELDFDHFEIGRSTDGVNFETLKNVNSMGNASSRTDYNWQDNDPMELNYYRLRSLDKDGAVADSKIVFIRTFAERKFEVFPNPIVDRLISVKLSFKPAPEDMVTIYNSQGHKVFQETLLATDGVYSFSISSNLSPGIYFMSLATEGNIYKRRLIINN